MHSEEKHPDFKLKIINSKLTSTIHEENLELRKSFSENLTSGLNRVHKNKPYAEV